MKNESFGHRRSFRGVEVTMAQLLVDTYTCIILNQGRIQKFSKRGDFCEGEGDYLFSAHQNI